MDPGLNKLLKWSIKETSSSVNGTSTDPSNPPDPNASNKPPRPPFDPDVLRALMGGPSDADLMKESMAAIQSPDISLPNKLVAFDNFEQLIEQIDNANNMQPLGLWTPLLAVLQSEEADLRRMAAWCMGTAVQNDVKAQEHLLATGAIPALMQLALEDADELVRRKAIYALSSGIRNYQPGLDAAVNALPPGMKPSAKLDAGDMEAVDGMVQQLRTKSLEMNTMK